MTIANRRILLYVGVVWLGISTVLFTLFEIKISLPSSIVLLILLIWYIQRNSKQKPTPTTRLTNDNAISKTNYYCISCGTKHTDESCPQCGSKMKRAGFYISYVLSISSVMIESGL
jgi:hypothetical protein